MSADLESVIQRLQMQLSKARIALRNIKFQAQKVSKPESNIVELVDGVLIDADPRTLELGVPCFNCGHTPRAEDVTIASLQDKLAMEITVKRNTQSDFDKNFAPRA